MAESFSIRRAFLRWWRESLWERGFWRTLGVFLRNVFELLRDLTPSRRRLRYGDMDFDWDHCVDTTWANVRLGTRIREMFSGRAYQPVDPELFRSVVRELEIDPAQYNFIDLGSGKGRALLLASEFPFRRIIGVELLPELHAIAEENVRRFTSPWQRCRAFELQCRDAREFTFPSGPLLLFLFDPFPEHVLEQVIANAERSWRADPRPFTVVYLNPISEHVLSNAPWLRRLRGNIQYTVYETHV